MYFVGAGKKVFSQMQGKAKLELLPSGTISGKVPGSRTYYLRISGELQKGFMWN